MENEIKEIRKEKNNFIINIDIKKAISQKKIIIEGIEIFFPYNPYPAQEVYMKKVILTLKKRGNISALESPTGTGKTLCLLCAILGWIKHNEKEKINIYYCTRTVSQIKNVMKELNKTCYIIKTSFLTSRKFACVKFGKEERNEYDICKLNDLCELYRKKKYCEYYKEEYSNYSEYDNLEDIEDLFKEGIKKEFCPYFYNLNKTEFYANITFMSYNYLLNPIIRNKLKKVIHENSIIILDEAHNISKVFEDFFSKNIKKKDLEKIKILLQIILDFNNKNKTKICKEKTEINPLFTLKEEELNEQINILNNFINNLNLLNVENNKYCQKIDDYINKNSYSCTLEYFKMIFNKLSFTFYKSLNNAINKLDIEEENEIRLYLNREIYYRYYKNAILKSIIKKPKKLYEFLDKLYNFKKEEEVSYKFIFSNEKQYSINQFEKENKKKGIFFEIYCIDSSYGMNDLLKIRPYSIILTSGTLSINTLENLLRINFKEKLHNNHVIKNSQFLAYLIPSFQTKDTKSNYSFILRNRGNKEQIISLGNEIYNMANSVKIGGILVFFQSYEYLNNCFKVWLSNKIINKFNSIKKAIFDFKYMRDKNEKLIKEGKEKKNLLLFTVYRGKNSEGINFPNDESRMVICIGVPYPNLSDIKVKLKKDFLDKKYIKERKGLNGWEWYREEGMIAVNQSLGRLIRNKDDYGIMICFGIEFKTNVFLLSKWIKNNMYCIDLNENNDRYYKKIENFLDNLKQINNNNIIENNLKFIEEGYNKKKNDDNNGEEKKYFNKNKNKAIVIV